MACFDISDTPKLRSAIKAIVKKYPDITLACFDRECYDRLYDMDMTNVCLYAFKQNYVMEKYNVIGALVSSDYDGNTYGLKEMRV